MATKPVLMGWTERRAPQLLHCRGREIWGDMGRYGEI
jgi:hypothetical protein